MGWIPTSERSNEPGEPKRPAKAFAGVEGIPAGGATPERGQARPLLPRMPSDFYRGRARARRAAFVAFVLVIGSLAFMAEAHVMDLGALFGPHVARSDWAFSMTGARDLSALGLTGRGVTVCLVDSGIDLQHPDFAHLRLVAWKDFVNLRPEAYDDRGHGTVMAGLIAANGSLRGIAPDAGLLVAKVINSAGFGSVQAVADGIRFCLDPFGDGTRGADIISISLGTSAPQLGGTGDSLAAQQALDRGVFVVAAAGYIAGAFDARATEVPSDPSLGSVVWTDYCSGSMPSFSLTSSRAGPTGPN